MLKYLYESGTAFFSFPNCPDFDIVVSIRYVHNSTVCFAPLLISVKACDVYSPRDAESNCKMMEKKLRKTGCHRALGLVIVIGSSVKSNDLSRKLRTKDIMDLFSNDGMEESKVIAKVLRVDVNDAFGISRAMIDVTSDGQEKSEVFNSHWMVRAHANCSEYKFAPCSMRKNKSRKRESYVFLSTLTKQLKKASRMKLKMASRRKMRAS
jgi:hypothetical protein